VVVDDIEGVLSQRPPIMGQKVIESV
jgi:hypothetical protein